VANVEKCAFHEGMPYVVYGYGYATAGGVFRLKIKYMVDCSLDGSREIWHPHPSLSDFHYSKRAYDLGGAVSPPVLASSPRVAIPEIPTPKCSFGILDHKKCEGGTVRYVIRQRMRYESSLREYYNSFDNGRVPLITELKIGIKLIEKLEIIHSNNIVHNNIQIDSVLLSVPLDDDNDDGMHVLL